MPNFRTFNLISTMRVETNSSSSGALSSSKCCCSSERSSSRVNCLSVNSGNKKVAVVPMVTCYQNGNKMVTNVNMLPKMVTKW